MADNGQRDEKKRGLPIQLQNAKTSNHCESYHGICEETTLNSSVVFNNNISQTNPLQYAQGLQHAHFPNIMMLSQQQRDNIVSVQQEKGNPQNTTDRDSDPSALSDNAKMAFTSSYSATNQVDTNDLQWDSAAVQTAEFLSADPDPALPTLSASKQSSQRAELPTTQRAQVPLAMLSDLTEALSRQPAAENSTCPLAAYPLQMPINMTSSQTGRNERRRPPEFPSVFFALHPPHSSAINSARFVTSEYAAATFHEPHGIGSVAYLQAIKSLPVLPVRLKRQYRHESFPERLSRMLKETEQAGQCDVVSFTPSGQAFKVHKLSLFTHEIIPKYFRHKCYPSFRRQLSMYGFQRIQIGPEEGSFAHPLFSRDHPELVRHIQRSADRATAGSEQKCRTNN